MKAIFTFITLFFTVSSAVSSEVLYLNENYILSAALCIVSIVSFSLWINSTSINVLITEKHAQQA